MFHRAGIGFLLLASSLAAQTVSQVVKPNSNAELNQLFQEDQRVRQPKPLGPDEPKIIRKDADRLALVKQMIANDQVHTSADYLHAAVILQHSTTQSDYLLAHTLAVLCAADGDKTCLWLSAATLDRYLQSIGQPQVYGTQFLHFDHPPITQEPYDSETVPDALRKAFGLPSADAQRERVEELNRQRETPAKAAPSVP